jgi:hypothetical protein
MRALFLFIAVILLLPGCEKDITLDLPVPEKKIVVEGYIEPGFPPVIGLSRNASLYSPTDTATISAHAVKGAIVEISDGSRTYALTEITYRGITVYTTPLLKGEFNKTYTLKITVDGDTAYFKRRQAGDSYGQLSCRLSDPPAPGNYYKYFAKRLGKDRDFAGNYSTVFDDRLVNGKSFDFILRRGFSRNPDEEEEKNELGGHYKVGDTIVLKWCTVDKALFDFWRTLERSSNSADNPFTTPITVKTNIKGGLGYWGWLGATYDTIIAR